LDMVMPNLSGAQVFQAFRKINPLAKILLISGYNKELEAGDMIKAGALGFIPKPFEIDQIISVVNN